MLPYFWSEMGVSAKNCKGLGQFFCSGGLGPLQSSMVWVWKISPINPKLFNFLPLRSKKSHRVGSKSTWVKDGSASYFLIYFGVLKVSLFETETDQFFSKFILIEWIFLLNVNLRRRERRIIFHFYRYSKSWQSPFLRWVDKKENTINS